MGSHPGPGRLTCEPCRERKVKCDRSFPKCSLCVRLGYTCSYRDRVRTRARLDAVIRQLQERVRQTEALLLPCERTSIVSPSSSSRTRCSISESPCESGPPSLCTAPTRTPSLPSPMSVANQCAPQVQRKDLFASEDGILGSFESGHGFMPSSHELTDFDMSLNLDMPLQFSFAEPTERSMALKQDMPTSPSTSHNCGPSAEVLAQLHAAFFHNMSQAWPIIAKESFYRRLDESPDSPSTRCVSYSVALLGTLVSEQCRQWSKSCYKLARQHVDACESEDMFNSLASIGLLQALLCLVRFDLGKRSCARAYMTLGRAVRLGAMMQLDQMDEAQTETNASCSGASSAVRIKLKSTHDLMDLEERRRCFWGFYILEGYASIHSGTSCLPNRAKLSLLLPCPSLLDDSFNPQTMPPLDRVAENTNADSVSAFAGLVIVISIIRRVLNHVSRTARCEPGFWDRHYVLVSTIEVHGALLNHLFSLRTLYSDATAFDVCLSFCAVNMLLYRTALGQAKQQGIASDVLICDVKERLLSNALRVASIIKSVWGMQQHNIDSLSLSGAFVAWPLSLAIQVLRQNVLTGKDNYAEHIHMLYKSLDDVEYTDGPWHTQVEDSAIGEY